MGTERKPISTAADWMRNVERKGTQQERRRQIYSASDLLGPGFGPTATQILDWNDEAATFTGFFWSPVGSLNSPDPTEEWIGYTISEDDRRYGVQKVFSVRSFDPPLECSRRFENPSASLTPVYTLWRGDLDWQSTGIVATGNYTITSQSWKRTGRTATITLDLTPTTSWTASSTGNLVNDDVAQVPSALVPGSELLPQGLGGGAFGPMQQYIINPDGSIQLVAIMANYPVDPTTPLSVSGRYLL